MPLQPKMRQATADLRERQDRAVHASPTALTWSRGALITAAVALMLAASGAFGTASAPFVVRLGYWLLALFSGVAWGVPLSIWFERRDWLRHPVQATVLLTLCIAVPQTVVVWALSGWIFGVGFDPRTLVSYAVPVFTVTAAMTALNVVANRQPVLTHAHAAPEGAAPVPAPAPRFLERIPRKLRAARLVALEAEDHYLRIHTDEGSDLILMRLSDAVAELDGIEGAQTHRSWWVAKDAVTGAQTGDGRAVLKLNGGVEAPVSRTYAKALRTAGWF